MCPSRRSEKREPAAPGEPVEVGPRLLRRWPLPQPDGEGDKEERGRVLVIGGSPEMPGAAVLAGTAALRAGVGKLRIAAPGSVAPWIGTAVPESRVFGMPETGSGALAPAAVERLAEAAGGVQCVLIGPGMADEEATARLVAALLPRLRGSRVVLDATALACLGREPELLRGLEAPAIVTPHAGEMASCLRLEKEEVQAAPEVVARRAAERFRAVVVLKGAETLIAGPDGRCFRNRAGNVGLATSGSGDTLAGIIAGLAARGADPAQAAVWGVYLHARAGDALARRVGALGFLARELAGEVPRLMARLGRGRE